MKKKTKIVYCDDNISLSDVYVENLLIYGFEVIYLNTTKAVVDLLDEDIENNILDADLFVIDVMFDHDRFHYDAKECDDGRRAGLFLAQEVRSVIDQVPIIIFSAGAIPEISALAKNIAKIINTGPRSQASYVQKNDYSPSEFSKSIVRFFKTNKLPGTGIIQLLKSLGIEIPVASGNPTITITGNKGNG